MAVPCARSGHGVVAGQANGRGLGGRAGAGQYGDWSAAWGGQGEMGRRDACPTLGCQGVNRHQLTSLASSSQPLLCCRVRIKTFRPGSGSPNASRYIWVMSLTPLRGTGSRPRAGPVAPLRPAGAARGLGKDHDVLGYGSRELQLEPQPPLTSRRLNASTGLEPKATGAGGQSSNGRPMRARALLMPTKCCWPVSGPHWARRGPLRTFAAARFQASCCSSVRRALKAFERAPKAPRAGPVAALRTFSGMTYALALLVRDHKEDNAAAPATFREIKRCHIVTAPGPLQCADRLSPACGTAGLAILA